MNDIDLSSYSNWDPIGENNASAFNGILDGNGYTISNLTINRPNEKNVGLFGVIKGSVEIKNLSLENIDIYGENSVGGLAGQNQTNNMAIISNCYSDGPVNGALFTGGIVGSNNAGIVTNCIFDTQKTGQSQAVGNSSGDNNNKGLTTPEMNNPANWSNWDETIWDLSSCPPRLQWQPKPPAPPIEDETVEAGNFRLQIGADSTESSAIYVDTEFDLGEFEVDFTSADSCASAIEDIDEALSEINRKRAEFGAVINRINTILTTQTITIQNYTSVNQ